MASYRGHLALAAPLGAAYGGAAAWQFGLDLGPVLLGGALTTLGGLLPDLDSDSGVPVRELFGLVAAGTPVLLFQRLLAWGLSLEETLVVLGCLYLYIRYGLAGLFQKFTVHRGMFHSLPAMLLAGLVVFLTYPNPDRFLRLFLAGGTMLGYLSHLVLDELYGVDFLGGVLRRQKAAGSALKLFSSSWTATVLTYGLLAGLGYLACQEWPTPGW